MEKNAADVLEEAADLLLIHGRCRGDAVDDAGRFCVVAAIGQAKGMRFAGEEQTALRAWLRDHEVESARVAPGSRVFCPVLWNDRTSDDFEIIDGLRLVAKSLRNGEQ